MAKKGSNGVKNTGRDAGDVGGGSDQDEAAQLIETILGVIGKEVAVLAKKTSRTVSDAKVLAEYGRLVLLVMREQRVADEDDADDMTDDEVTALLIKTVGADKLKRTLQDLGAL